MLKYYINASILLKRFFCFRFRLKHVKFLCVYFFSTLAFGQVGNNSLDTNQVDDKYREDQFYASITYNLLGDKPSDISQNGFSTGFHLGYIRDMPINKQRNLALGLGLGISSNSFNHNLFISEVDANTVFSITESNQLGNVSKNKFTTYLVEVPLEFRWRTSTASDYNFWRIYAGFKLGYLLYNSTKFRSESGNLDLSNISDFNEFQYGLTLSAGYGNWNFHMYYGLNPIFNSDAQLNGQSITMNAIKIGLMFYIL